jgi:hypothetical protein
VQIEQYPTVMSVEYIEGGLVHFWSAWLYEYYGVAPEKRQPSHWQKYATEPVVKPELIYESILNTSDLEEQMHKFLIANTTEHWEVHCYVPVGHYWWRNTEKDYPTSNVILINGNVTIKVIELGLLPVIAIESFPVDE